MSSERRKYRAEKVKAQFLSHFADFVHFTQVYLNRPKLHPCQNEKKIFRITVKVQIPSDLQTDDNILVLWLLVWFQEAEAFKAKVLPLASASASQFQKDKASSSASWLGVDQ